MISKYSIGLLAVLAAGCSEQFAAPQITAAVPDTISADEATTVTIEGAHFYGYASTSLDTASAPTVDEGWTVTLGSLGEFEAELVSTEELVVSLPAGLAEGLYDIVATSSDGREAQLAGALTVTSEPITNAFRIVAVEHPPRVIPGTKGIPVDVVVENGLTESVPITGVELSFEAGARDDEYYVFPYAGNPQEVPAGATRTFRFMVGVDGSAAEETVSVTARVDGFLRTGRLHMERREDTSWLIASGVPIAPQPSAPTGAARLCAGSELQFDGSESVGDGELAFFWDLPGSVPGSAEGPTASVAYETPGAYLYSLTISDSSSESVRFGEHPIFVGETGAAGAYPTGPIRLSSPAGNQALDMANLPSTSFLRQGEGLGVRRCNGNELPEKGNCYLTVASDRGAIDVAEDSQPEVAGIQVRLSECNHFGSLTFTADDAGLEGTGLICVEARDEGTGAITAAAAVSFRMTGDVTAPTLEPLLPAASCTEECLGEGEQLVVQFSEPMDAASLLANARVERSNATNCEGAFTDITAGSQLDYDAGARILRVFPSTADAALYSVRLVFPTSITDASLAANALATEQSICAVVGSASDTPVPSVPASPLVAPATFSPDGDGVDEKVSFGATTDATTQLLVANIQRGSKLVRTLVIPTPVPDTYRVVWDGRDSDGRVVPNDYYAIHIHSENALGEASSPITEITQVARAVSCIGQSSRF